MNLAKYRAYTGFHPYCLERIDEIQQDMVGSSWSDLDDEWKPMVHADRQLGRLPPVTDVHEVGAGGDRIILYIHEDEWVSPLDETLEKKEEGNDMQHNYYPLLEEERAYLTHLGDLCSYILADSDIMIHATGRSNNLDGYIAIELSNSGERGEEPPSVNWNGTLQEYEEE